MSKTRTFIAIEATDEVESLALLMIDQLRPYAPSMNWVAPGNLHWTLQFLGDVQDEQIYEICRDVNKVATNYECFSLTSESLGAFPSLEKPRTIWLGASDGSDTLCQFQADIEDRMSDLGFRPEGRRFVPHLTLGRLGRNGYAGPELKAQLSNLQSVPSSIMSVDEVIVFGSELSREGPTYHVLGRAALP